MLKRILLKLRYLKYPDMPINIDKCQALHIGKSNPKQSYKIH